MSYYALFVDKRRGKVHLWDDEEGKVDFPIDAIKYAYKKSPNGEFKSIYDETLEEVSNYIENDPDILESDVSLEVKILSKIYETDDEVSKTNSIGIIDIEVDSTGGFPNIETGDKVITAIAIYDTLQRTFTSFALDPDKKITSKQVHTKIKDSDKEYCKWEVRSFPNEQTLLKAFLNKWRRCQFSIVTGWNIRYFDMPYLYSRIRTVLGRDASYRLSPINICYMNKFTRTMVIAGISCLDYLELYKKFIGKDQPNFSLGYIGQEEVGIGKVQYRGSLVTLYNEDLNKYIEYNLTDVKIVAALDQKLDFIHLARSVCHKGYCPYEWYMYSSRWIDGALLAYLHRNKLIAPNKPQQGKEMYESIKNQDEEGFEGAYVKDPIPGLYDWVYSADITSLYPSTIMTLNISPDAKIGKIENWNVEEFATGKIPENIVIDGKPYSKEEFMEVIADNKVSISANGVLYSLKKPGLIPEILVKWFDERVEYRKLAKKYKEEGNKEKELFYDRRQKAQKIILNSVYGITGLPISRWYDKDNAEATTISGQKIIIAAQNYVNMVYNEKLGNRFKVTHSDGSSEIIYENQSNFKNGEKIGDIIKNYKTVKLEPQDFVIYVDTDSIFSSAKPLLDVEKLPIEDKSKYVIDLSKEITNGINKFYEYAVPAMFNVKYHRIKIMSDVIASAGFWVKKKRYALLKIYDMEKQQVVHDKDGNIGKLEVKGIDVVRTSFPAKFRKFSGELLIMILKKKTQQEINNRILQMEKEIRHLPIEDVAKNTSVNFVSADGATNYNPQCRELFTIPTLKTPPQVGAALMYNDLLRKFNLENKFEPIHNGQKIKWVYLKENPYALDYLAMKADGTDPDEILDVIKIYVDRQLMYERELKTKLVKFFDVLNWRYPSFTATIADMFFAPKSKNELPTR